MMARELVEAFGVLAEAPGGVKRLRELVLQLAVRGKLVPQDPGDEPAETSRTALLAAALVERTSRITVAFEHDIPFQIPESWQWVFLGQATGLVNGKAFKPTEWSDRGVKIVRIQNLNDTKASFNHCNFDVPEKFFIDDGNLLVSWSGTPGTSFGAFIWGRGRAILNQHIFRCEPRGNAYIIEFMRLAINSRLSEMIARAHGGVGLQHVTKGELEGLRLPLPPLAEQHRIVAKVDELMAFLDKLEAAKAARDATRASLRDAALAALRDADSPDEVEAAWARIAEQMDDLFVEPGDVGPLRQAVLQLAVRGRLVRQDPADQSVAELLEAVAKLKLAKAAKVPKVGPKHIVGPPFDVPSCWAWVSLGDLVTNGPTNGWSPTTVDSETATKTLKLSATTSGQFNAEKFKYVDAAIGAESPLWLESGDLLIQRSNTPEYVGMAAVFDGPPKTFIYPDLMMRCRVAAPVPVEFIHLCLISPHGRSWFAEHASGTSASMVKLAQAEVRATPVPLPPLAEQHRIVAKVDELMALLDKLESRLLSAKTLQAAFAAAAVHHLDVETNTELRCAE